jgi:hypothetical protein
MTTPNTFLQRMQPTIDGMVEGADKEKLLALVESQDTVERSDVHPKDRARAMRRMLQIDGSKKHYKSSQHDDSRKPYNGLSSEAKGGGKKPQP